MAEERAVSRRRRLWMAATLLLAACRAPATPLDEALAGGARVASLVARDRPTVLLVYPPKYTFACAAELLKWRALDQAGRVHAVLVLNRAPSEADRKALAIRRVHVAGVITRPFWRGGGEPPKEYLVENGRITVVGSGTGGTGYRSPVLARFDPSAAATVAAARPPRTGGG